MSILPESHLFAGARRVLEEAVAARAFPGAAFGVLSQGKVVALDAVGGFTYEPASPHVLPATVFDLASVSKVVATTAAAMLLYQRGVLKLDMPLGKLLPGFVATADGDEQRQRVTLRHLLAHASGLPGYAPLYRDYSTPESLFTACLHLPLTASPGERAEYSDIGFILLGKALEILAGEPLDQFCAREVFAPLGMLSAHYRPAAEEREQVPPTEIDEVFRRAVIQGVVHDENCWVLGGCAGHAGLFSNALDLLRFAEALLSVVRRQQAPAVEALFEVKTVRLFTTRAGLPEGSSRALGWDTPSTPSSSGNSFSSWSAGHLGYTGTSLWIDIDRDLAVVLLTNRTFPSRENKQIQAVRPLFHDTVSDLLQCSQKGKL